MIQDLTISGFLEELSSKQPTPGGGGAAALIGAHGVALGEMVIQLTLGKKKYADVEVEMQQLLLKLECLKKDFLRLADEDAAVFAPLAAAYGLPSGTQEEKEEKEKVLESHLLSASLVPKTVMERSLEGLEIMDRLADKGSRMAVSDVGVGAYFLRSALLSAKMNVLINTKLMKQRETAEELNEKVTEMAEAGKKLSDAICFRVEEHLK